MPGKVNSNLSTSSIQALRAERQEGGKISSFWNKWSNLSTGQKWGRALAWLIPPLGIGLQAGANLWQARQAKAAAARPMQTTSQQSNESINNIPLSSQTTFGKNDRKLLADKLANHPDILNPTLSKGERFIGLAEQFEKDVNRNAEVHLNPSTGSEVVTINNRTFEPGKALRDFFRLEFPENEEKAEQWAGLTSKYANQITSVLLNGTNSEVTGFRCTQALGQKMLFTLRMEQGGTSALLESRLFGGINNISSSDYEGFLAYNNENINWEKSYMEETLFLRLKLGSPEEFQVISACTKYDLVPIQDNASAKIAAKVPLKQDVNQGVQKKVPVPQIENEKLIKNDEASDVLQKLALEMVKPNSHGDQLLQKYKDQLAAQDSPDLTAFKDAFSVLTKPDGKQKVIEQLAEVLQGKDFSDYGDQIDKGSEFGQLFLRKLNEENLNVLYDNLVNDPEYPLEDGISRAQFLVDANDYQLYSMGIKQIPDQEVLNLEKRLVPRSREYAAAIAEGTASAADIKNMVEQTSSRLLSIATESKFRAEVSEDELEDLSRILDPRTKVTPRYPLADECFLIGKLLLDSVRDFDIQNFSPSKGEEEFATRLLGVAPEAYFSALKPKGPDAVIAGSFLSNERLHPISQKLRTDLVQAFDQSTTLDDFYSKAQTLIDNARIEASELSRNQ